MAKNRRITMLTINAETRRIYVGYSDAPDGSGAPAQGVVEFVTELPTEPDIPGVGPSHREVMTPQQAGQLSAIIQMAQAFVNRLP